MARQVKRNVRRMEDRGQVMRSYHTRSWYNLPDWAQQWLVDNTAWIVLGFTVILAPAVLLALTIGFRSLPLEFLGIPATDNDAGFAVVALLVKFTLLALAYRPLRRREIKGWHLVIAAAAAHLAHSVFLQHAISGATLLLVTVYCYTQVRRWYS